jgi:hypothetical protein
MTNVPIDLYRVYKRGNYISQGEFVSFTYEIQDENYSGYGSNIGGFIIGSGSPPDYFPSLQDGLDYYDDLAFTYFLSTMNGNTSDPTGNTYVEGVIEDLPRKVSTALQGKQPLNTKLTALAGATLASDKMLYATGTDSFGGFDTTTYGRGLLNTSDATALRSAVGAASSTHTHTASDISDFNTAADARITAQKGANSGLATLDSGGKIPNTQLPALAVTSVRVVTSQSAQLALTAQEGDVAVRWDENKSYMHNGGTAGTMADWTELLNPTGAVSSFNGRTGTVMPTSGDYGSSLIANNSTVSGSTVTDALNTLKTRSFSNGVSRSLVSTAAAANGFQLSTTRDAIVNYSVSIATTVSVSGNAVGYVALEVCPTNSSTANQWIEISRVASGQTGTIVVGLTLNQTGGGSIGGTVPAGWYARLRTVNSSGTPTYTYNSGQEVLL